MSWSLDTAHSHVSFSVRHMMITKVRGQFDAFSGTVAVTDGDPDSLVIQGSVETQSVSTRNEQRDGHLRSADFFDAEQYPAITFTSTAVAVSGSKVTVTGDLTVRDQTRSITLHGTVEGPSKDPWGQQRIGVSLAGKINREDFGLTWNQALEAGGVLVGKEVSIDVDLQAIQS